MTQLNFSDIFRLHLVYAEAVHQVRHNVGFFLGFADNLDGLVDVEQYLLQTFEQVQTLLLFVQRERRAALYAVHAEPDPLFQQPVHAEHLRGAVDQHVEIAGEAVLQRSELVELLHELVGVGGALEVNGDTQAVKSLLVADVGNLLDLARLDQVNDLFYDLFAGGGGRNLRDVNAVGLAVVGVAGTNADAAAPRVVDLFQLRLVVDDLSAAGEVWRQQGSADIVLGIFQKLNGGFDQLIQIEGTDRACHADGNTRVAVAENRRKGDREQGRLFHGVVEVVHHVHRVIIYVAEQFAGDRRQLCLGVSGSSRLCVAGIRLAEGAFGIDIGVKQRFISHRHANHGVINRRVAVGVQCHGGTGDFG